MKIPMYTIGLAFLFLFISFPLSDRTITGTVTNEGGDPLIGATVQVKGTTIGVITDIDGHYELGVPAGDHTLIYSYTGYTSREIKIGADSVINVVMSPDANVLEEVVVVGYATKNRRQLTGTVNPAPQMSIKPNEKTYNPGFNTEDYASIDENAFREVRLNPLSTFSVDVDAASYSNVRRYLTDGALPPAGAVRVEEMINYFKYDYPQPEADMPFSIYTELSSCPWNEENKLLHIGLQGKNIETEDLPPSNLVFLIDVSGSMASPNKLPLLKQSFKLMTEQLREKDRVAIVVYAGNSGLVLPATPGNEKETILRSLKKLRAGGSTAGGAGLKLAYKVANENFVENGNNRIILATDGDFNVGVSSDAAMKKLVTEEREKGISISVLGFGTGNIKDNKMEIIADHGNGNYAYIDNILEAKKVLVKEFGGTLFTIAKDVKFQLEFNPAQVEKYRLIGYENRLLNEEDFKDDKKDAGEIGAGHTVTALYEIVPAKEKTAASDLKYQQVKWTDRAYSGNELVTLKLRYKAPMGDVSKLIETVVSDQPVDLELSSDNFRFSAAIAAFGMLLRDSEYKGELSWQDVEEMAQTARGTDKEGYRAEFIRMIESAQLIASN